MKGLYNYIIYNNCILDISNTIEITTLNEEILNKWKTSNFSPLLGNDTDDMTRLSNAFEQLLKYIILKEGIYKNDDDEIAVILNLDAFLLIFRLYSEYNVILEPDKVYELHDKLSHLSLTPEIVHYCFEHHINLLEQREKNKTKILRKYLKNKKIIKII